MTGRFRKVWSTYIPYVLGICGNAGLNILLISLLTHRLIPAVYGSYMVSMTVIVVSSSIVGQWLQQATGRYLAGATAAISSYTKAAVLLGIGGILAVLAAVYATTALIGVLDSRLVDGLWLIDVAAIAAQTLFSLAGSALQAGQRAWAYALQQTCAGSLKIGLSELVCHVSSQNVGGLIYAYAAAQLVGAAFGAWQAGFFRRAVLVRLGSRRAKMVFHKLHIYGGAMTVWFIFMNLAMYLDRLLIRGLGGATMAGLYGAASTLVVGSVNLVMAPILAATWPQLMVAWNMRNEQMAARLLGDLLTWLLCAGVTLVAMVNAVADPATRLFLGNRFGAASTLLPLLAASAFSFSLGPFFHKPLEFKERKTAMCLFAATALLLHGLLSVLLTTWLGGVGAGTAALIAGTTYCVLCAVYGRKIVRWRIRTNLLAVIAVLAAIASLAARRFSASWHIENNLGNFLAAGATFTVIFGAALAVTVVLHVAHRRMRIPAIK